MSDPVVLLSNITKEYYIERPRSLKKWFHNIFLPFKKHKVFKNFSLKILKGEFVLIHGPNGCGKSTLLKLIAGIIYPDKGKIQVTGKVVPLIELGAGFNYELTGRENIFINATILGIEKKAILQIMPEIISFAQLEEFIDTPVKRYSTGMLSRLAFSIAAFSQPDILLIDELLAVGDTEFRRKALKRLKYFKQCGVTIILCSHQDIGMKLIDRVIKLDKIIPQKKI